MLTGPETVIATQVARRALPVIRNVMQGGDVGRLIDAIEKTLSKETGLSATALGPLKQDEAFGAAFATYVRTGRLPREEFVAAIEPYVGALNDTGSPRETAETFAPVIEAF